MNIDCPKVSIGITSYNHQEFIVECLESIKNQTYKNIELIVSDDCSPDDSIEVIKNYQKENPDFKFELVAHKKNLGISKNCNQLLDRLSGDYFCLFAGDDIMMPDRIEKQVKALEENKNAIMCFTNTMWFWSETGRNVCKHFGVLQKPSLDIKKVIADFSIPTPTLLIRSSLGKNLKYDESLKYVNDFKYVIDLIKIAPVIYIDEVLTRYRKHKESATMTNYFTEDRFRLIDIFKSEFGKEYEKSIDKYEKVAYYALIMDNIKSGNKKQALKLLYKIFPDCLLTPKWWGRCFIIFRGIVLK